MTQGSPLLFGPQRKTDGLEVNEGKHRVRVKPLDNPKGRLDRGDPDFAGKQKIGKDQVLIPEARKGPKERASLPFSVVEPEPEVAAGGNRERGKGGAHTEGREPIESD